MTDFFSSFYSAFSDYMHQRIKEKGILMRKQYLDMSEVSRVPEVMPEETKNLLFNLHQYIKTSQTHFVVKNVFDVSLSEQEAIYFLIYIGTMSSLKSTKTMKEGMKELRHHLDSTFTESHNALIRISEILKIPPTKDALVNYLANFTYDSDLLKTTCQDLVKTLNSLDESINKLNNLEYEINSTMIDFIGLDAVKAEGLENLENIRQLAEKYYIDKANILSKFKYYSPN